MAATNDLIPDFDDFERYCGGEMSSAEQRSLEGRMLAEPLVAEAYEGFLAWRAQHAQVTGVRADLRERLHTRMAHARRNALPLWAYASAASVLLVLLVYWNMFLYDKKVTIQKSAVAVKQEEMTSSTSEQATLPAPIKLDKPLESAAPAPTGPNTSILTKPVPASQPKQAPQTLPRPEIALAPFVLADEKARQEAELEAIDTALADSFQAETAVAQAPPQPAKALAAPGSAQAVAKSMAGRVKTEPSSWHTISKKSEEINKQYARQELLASKPVAGDKKTDNIVVPADTLAPIPAAGWASYRVYLDKNTGSASTTGQIVVTFIVSSSGTLSGIVAKGPQELQKDAIRIISNGPAWAPARSNGMPVTSVGEIQLWFRQKQ